MNASGDRVNKKVILAIIITLVIILAIIGGYFLYKNYDNKKLNGAAVTGYGIGYNQSFQDVAQGQTQTGSILIWADDSIQVRSIQDICSGLF